MCMQITTYKQGNNLSTHLLRCAIQGAPIALRSTDIASYRNVHACANDVGR